MKRLICMLLAAGMICSLAGCQEKGLPKPAFPLEKDVIVAAMEQTGLPGVISESETQSYREGHISYTLRDPVETYKGTDNKRFTVAVSSATTEGKRQLQTIFDRADVRTPFAWNDWKQQIIFATLLYGGFEDAEAVYRAFSDQELPEDAETVAEDVAYGWQAQLPGGYCTVSYRQRDSRSERSSLGNVSLERSATVFISMYESEAVYQEIQQDIAKKKAELESSRAETLK